MPDSFSVSAIFPFPYRIAFPSVRVDKSVYSMRKNLRIRYPLRSLVPKRQVYRIYSLYFRKNSTPLRYSVPYAAVGRTNGEQSRDYLSYARFAKSYIPSRLSLGLPDKNGTSAGDFPQYPKFVEWFVGAEFAVYSLFSAQRLLLTRKRQSILSPAHP